MERYNIIKPLPASGKIRLYHHPEMEALVAELKLNGYRGQQPQKSGSYYNIIWRDRMDSIASTTKQAYILSKSKEINFIEYFEKTINTDTHER